MSGMAGTERSVETTTSPATSSGRAWYYAASM
jgi:hypothetical protein